MVASTSGCKWAHLADKLGRNPHEERRLEEKVLPTKPKAKLNPTLASDLPYYHYDGVGSFEMRWGFFGVGMEEEIELEFTLSSDIFSGIGFDCTSSRMCDMVVGNGGGRNEAFLEDFFEVEGDREPHTDEELGGTNDLKIVKLDYNSQYQSVLRFRRKLNTGDKWDAEIKKDYMDLVYAWCEEPFCVDTHSAHAPGSWNIISVDMSGGQSEMMREQAVKMVEEADCTAGSEDLCSCSQLIKRGAIDTFDECTQEAAIEYCKQFGGCSVSGTF
ncbi:hypothetical protein TL16_g09019 [Triparma laevis f. inornata]|uniref:DOMON domain-containing protein n=1 Tax=Triparma laevis f. inornata TaxID=1714386 RepID=A0A9W7B5Y6_9STRA|nr:hypothetical protein TL16_g09019 [Triparma laevis f. inornata]